MHFSDIVASFEKTLIVVSISATFVLIYFFVLKFIEIYSQRPITNMGHLCITAFIFGLLAIVVGVITGASRSTSVGNVVPAALGLVGAVALYVVTREKANISIAATAVISFSTLLLLGTVLGSFERSRFVLYQSSLSYDFKNLKHQADLEFAINGYRRSRGLEPIAFKN